MRSCANCGSRGEIECPYPGVSMSNFAYQPNEDFVCKSWALKAEAKEAGK